MVFLVVTAGCLLVHTSTALSVDGQPILISITRQLYRDGPVVRGIVVGIAIVFLA